MRALFHVRSYYNPVKSCEYLRFMAYQGRPQSKRSTHDRFGRRGTLSDLFYVLIVSRSLTLLTALTINSPRSCDILRLSVILEDSWPLPAF